VCGDEDGAASGEVVHGLIIAEKQRS